MKRAENYDLINAAEEGDFEKVKSFILQGISINICSGKRNDFKHQYEPEGMTPLHYAAKRGYDDIVKILIDAGAEINYPDGFKRSPLHYAAYPANSGRNANDLESARMLIEAGADINALDQDNKTCLRFAVEDRGNPDMVKYLIRMGVNQNIPDVRGRTPKTVAIEYGNYELIKLL